jgi:hypothetical protein
MQQGHQGNHGLPHGHDVERSACVDVPHYKRAVHPSGHKARRIGCYYDGGYSAPVRAERFDRWLQRGGRETGGRV